MWYSRQRLLGRPEAESADLFPVARAIGLGTVLTTLHRRRKAQIHDILGIPDTIESATIIPPGWRGRDYGPIGCPDASLSATG